MLPNVVIESVSEVITPVHNCAVSDEPFVSQIRVSNFYDKLLASVEITL
jgi:hypothetical protein